MTPPIILDENVSLLLVGLLKDRGHEVIAIAEGSYRGLVDRDVFDLAASRSAALVTRDGHFTNPVRYEPAKTAGILHIVHGNLTSTQEADLVTGFLETHAHEGWRGRLVLISRGRSTIR